MASEQEIKLQQEKLELERLKLDRERYEFEQKKLQRFTIAVSFIAVLVSGLQVGVSVIQSKLNQAQTLEKFIPYLQNPETKDVAILVMRQFSEEELVTRLASAVKATSALQELKTQGNPTQQKQAKEALDEIAQKRTALIKRMFGDDKADRILATNILLREWRDDAKVVAEVVSEAARQSDNKSGVINTLVLIRDFPPDVLRANEAEIEALLRRVEGNGEQTAGFVGQVRERMRR